MRRAMLLVFLLLLWPGHVALGEQSNDREPLKQPKEKNQQASQPLTNDAIVKLVKASLTEEAIVAIVNTQPGNYSLSADDVAALKKAGVSDRVISAMISRYIKTISNESNVQPARPSSEVTMREARPTDSNQAKPPTSAQSKPDSFGAQAGPDSRTDAFPHEAQPPTLREDTPDERATPGNNNILNLIQAPGLYCATEHGPRPIVGRAVVFRRTGSRLAGTVTFGIVSGKVNIQIPGKHAGTYLGSKPVFYYHLEADDKEGTLNLVLARLKVYHDRRQLEAKASGFGRESQGVSINSQIQTDISLMSPSVFRVAPAQGLQTGEYAFYLRTTGASTQDAYLYDFSVE